MPTDYLDGQSLGNPHIIEDKTTFGTATEGATTEIAETVYNVENFLIGQGVPSEEIEPMKLIIKNLKIGELINMCYANDTIYSMIKPGLLESYAKSVEKGGYLSEYWAGEIINKGDKKDIECIRKNLEENQKKNLKLDEGKTINILNKLMDYYRKYKDSFLKEDENQVVRKNKKEEYENVEKKLIKMLQMKYRNSEGEDKKEFGREYKLELEQLVTNYLSKYEYYYSLLDNLENSLVKAQDDSGESSIVEQDKIIEEIKSVKNVIGGVHGITDQIYYLVTEGDIIFSKELFTRLEKYQDFYFLLIDENVKFDINQEDRRNLFNKMLVEDYGKGVHDKNYLLGRIKESIDKDKFEGLKDEDYINLYFSLYPNRKSTITEIETEKQQNNSIIETSNNLAEMPLRDFSDFVDLVKTTKYWNDDVRTKCYNHAKSKGYWEFILINCAMGYFQTESLKEDLNGTNSFNGIEYDNKDIFREHIDKLILKFLPLFKDTISNDELNQILNGKTLDENLLNSIALCRDLMENRKILKKGGRGRIK